MVLTDGEDENFLVGKEFEFHGLREGDDVELFPVERRVIH